MRTFCVLLVLFLGIGIPVPNSGHAQSPGEMSDDLAPVKKANMGRGGQRALEVEPVNFKPGQPKGTPPRVQAGDPAGIRKIQGRDNAPRGGEVEPALRPRQDSGKASAGMQLDKDDF